MTEDMIQFRKNEELKMKNKKEIKQDLNVSNSSLKIGISGLPLGNCKAAPALSGTCTPERRKCEQQCVGCWMNK